MQSAALLPQKLSFLSEKKNALSTVDWRTEHLSLHSTYEQSMNTTKVIHDPRPENITKVMLLFFAEYHLSGMKKAENQKGSLLDS